MTAIACKDGMVAADSSVWHGDVQCGGARKLMRLDDGSIFGAGGWQPCIETALEWIKAGMPPTSCPAAVEPNDLDGLLLRPDRSIWIITHKFHIYRSHRECEAVGAHPEFLYGAMLTGASAEEAVRAAIRHCAKAAGDVQVERLADEAPKEMGLIQCPIHGDKYSEDDRCPLCAEAAAVLPRNGGGPAFCGLAFHQEAWLEANRPKIW